MNSHLHLIISTVEISELNNAEDYDNAATSETQGSDSREELNSHSNMSVVDQNWYIISDSGTSAEVNAISPDYKTKNIPIVDAAVRYDCPHRMMTYILLICNDLHVNSMTNNLMPPFMLQEVGILVYDTPKIQVENPTFKDNSIYFQQKRFIIHLQLWGVFSYLPTSKTTFEDMMDSEEVYMLTASICNPHDKA